MNDVENAFRSATWGNTTETPGDWAKILASDDDDSRFRIFEKLFREDSTGTHVKKLFALEEIKTFLQRLTQPYHRRDQERRRLAWRSTYLDMDCEIPELAWVILPRGDH